VFIAEFHSILENTVVVYKRERSSLWQARLRLDDGTWHRVSTKTGGFDEAADRAKVLYYEARVKAQVLQQHYSHITPEMVASRLAGKIDSAQIDFRQTFNSL
jgi:integrase